MLIKTAGYMWNRKYVDWTKRKLIGTAEEGGAGQTVNFAEQSAVYGLFDSNHQCVYVGQAGRGNSSTLYDRLRSHALEDSLFCLWERFTWFGFYSAKDLQNGKFADPLTGSVSLAAVLNEFETVGFYLALPRHNLRSENGFAHVNWYYQEDEYQELKNAKPKSEA